MAEDFSAYQMPQSDEEALARFKQFEHTDPLPNVPPALLNAADIYAYARITGMVWPFPRDPKQLQEKLKPASYEIDFLGEVYYADDNGKQEKFELQPDKPFTLPKNSIRFVCLTTQFRLPDYIAIRFNLKITHVHRGLLLGTGPLVDPGFAGRLLIPLHNLTSDDYKLTGGEGLIWVEFTKLSPNTHWNADTQKTSGDFEPFHFPDSKRNLSPQRYFNKASNGTPAVSSIPGEIRTARDSAQSARRWARNLTIAGAIALIISVLGMLVPTWDLISSANKNVADASNTMRTLHENQVTLQKRVEVLENELRGLRESKLSATSLPPANAEIDKSGRERAQKRR